MGVFKTLAGKRSEAMLFFKTEIEARPAFIKYWVPYYVLLLIRLEKSAKIFSRPGSSVG